MQSSLCLPISESSQVGDARRKAAALADVLGLSEEERGRLSIVATEITNNLVKHTQGGELVLTPITDPSCRAVELLALDKGPGMPDINRCLADGYSTGGTSGNGMGAIQRLSDEFDIYSQPKSGTIVLSRIGAPSKPTHECGGIEYGAISVPIRGETRCGDAWAVAQSASQCRLAVMDGLGHGALASDAAELAVSIFSETLAFPPIEVLEAEDRGLRSSRGAVMAIAQVDYESTALSYCGVGNISAMILTDRGESHSMVSLPGTLGHRIPRVQQFSYQWPKTALLVMYSDGVSSHWSLSAYPGLKMKHPSIVAAVIYRDFCRGRDDATVLVARWKE